MIVYIWQKRAQVERVFLSFFFSVFFVEALQRPSNLLTYALKHFFWEGIMGRYLFKKIWEMFPGKESFLVVLAFILTTLAGGLLTSRFQERLWMQQNEDSKRIREIEIATKTFEDLSGTIDRRIYRMDKLVRWMEDNSDQKMIERQMKEYRNILYEWNDSYNKNKAKLKLYFGLEIAARFDYIHGFFKDVGKTLEKEYYTSPDQRDGEQLRFVGDRVGDLNNMALEINERMIEKIQSQEVGVFLKRGN